METLESSRVCRLCGQHSGICINIFDKNETHVKKINAVLPILVHEMDLLPKQMCHRCSYKLEEFHKFYSDCLKTDMDLKSQLSWMRKRDVKEDIRVPMVQIENVKIKSEPPDYDIYELDPIVENVNYISSMSTMTFSSMNSVRNNNEVDSHRIGEIDQRLRCDNRYDNCSHCKYNYDKNRSTNDDSINRTNIRSKRNVKRDLGNTDLGGSSRLNTFQNSHGNDISKEAHKAKKKYHKEEGGINIDNILNTDEVKEIKIKTEKPDDIEIRSLRPRNKSVDYLGIKRKKSTLIINPANVSKGLDAKRKSTANKQKLDTIVNGIVIDAIKKEPLEEVQSRTLRPRRFLVNYLGSKRKEVSCARTEEQQNKSKSKEVGRKRYKSSNGCKEASSFGSGKRITGLISNPNEFKIKDEIISDDETLNVGENEVTGYNGIAKNCVRNLSNLFDRETELAIKVEDNIGDGFSDPDWEANSVDTRENRRSRSLVKSNTSKLKSKKLAAKRISDTNCSPKYLRSQDLRLRNGKVKKSESDRRLSIRNLKKRFLEITTTGRKPDRNSPSKIKDNLKVNKVVPTGLKTSSNIKHFCEKCCTSYMNKELYMLHACYSD